MTLHLAPETVSAQIGSCHAPTQMAEQVQIAPAGELSTLRTPADPAHHIAKNVKKVLSRLTEKNTQEFL